MAEVSRKVLRRTRNHAAKIAQRTLVSLANGLAYLQDSAARPTMGNAPKELVFERGKLRLWRLLAPPPAFVAERPSGAPAAAHAGGSSREARDGAVRLPIVLIPPLMVRPYIYDLLPEHSLLRTLRDAGFDVFFIDFGVPDRADEGLRLDDYVLDFIPTCVEQVRRKSGAEQLTLAGYCMGGIFALLYVATSADAHVEHLVTIGAPVDFEEMGIITVAARLGAPFVDLVLSRLGNVPGRLSSAAFRLLGGFKSITRYVDLLANLYDEQYVRGFDAIETWLSEMVPYPREAFRQMVKDVVRGNKLLKNELWLGERRADLKAVTCPLLAFAGDRDGIATPASTAAILDLVGSTDKTHRIVPGGHIGVVAGSQAKRAVWQPMIAWLGERRAEPDPSVPGPPSSRSHAIVSPALAFERSGY